MWNVKSVLHRAQQKIWEGRKQHLCQLLEDEETCLVSWKKPIAEWEPNKCISSDSDSRLAQPKGYKTASSF